MKRSMQKKNEKYSAHAKWGLKSDIKSEISGGGDGAALCACE